MNIVLIPVAGLMLIILVYILKSIPKKENKHEIRIKAIIILLFLISYIAFCYFIQPAH
jgi:Na+/melibiose symporter-like transporter